MQQLAVFQQSPRAAGPRRSAVLEQCQSTAAPCYLPDTAYSNTTLCEQKHLASEPVAQCNLVHMLILVCFVGISDYYLGRQGRY